MAPSASDDAGESHVGRGAGRDVIDVEWWSASGSLGGLVRVDARSDRGATAFLAAVVGPGRPPVVVVDHDLALPSPSFRLRAPGIWAELVCEEPLDHWTMRLEAFGLAVDAAELVGPSTFGDRVPLGFDLDLDTVGPPRNAPGGLEIDVRVHGEVLVADEAFDLDGAGVRRRRWDGMDPVLQLRDESRSIVSLQVDWPRLADDGSPPRRHLVGREAELGWQVEPGRPEAETAEG